MESLKKFFGCILFVLTWTYVSGQIDVAEMRKINGDGLYTLKKKMDVSFFLDEKTNAYYAKVKYNYEQLHINSSNENGLVQLPFNTYQDLKISKAKIFKLDTLGEKILVENIKVKYVDTKDYFIENIFYNDLKVKQFRSEVDLPENYVVNYSYEVIYKDLKFLTTLYLQYANEYIKHAEITIRKNPNVEFEVFEFNHKDNVKRKEEDDKIKYSCIDLKRFRSGTNSVGGNYYLPHIIVSVKSVKTKGGSIKILDSIENVYAWYNSLIQDLSPNESYLKNINSKLGLSGMSNDEKIKTIFTWVQNNIQYVAFEDGIAGFKPSEAHSVAKSKFGDCKGMANLLVGLLKAEGFDARHAWIGTRSNNYNYSIPSLAVDNHMICYLNFNNKKYYLDATSKSATWNVSPSHLEGKEVLVGSNNEYQIETIEISNPEVNKIRLAGKVTFKGGEAVIDLNVSLTGHFTNRYLGYNTHFPGIEFGHNHIYLIEDYLPWLDVKSYSSATVSGDNTSFTLSGTINEMALSKKQITLFPFFDILPYDELLDDNPPLYIDFPFIISLDVHLPYPVAANDVTEAQVTNNSSSNFISNREVTSGNVGKHYKQQIIIKALHTSLVDSEEWNTFVRNYKSQTLIPVTYAQP